MRHPDYAQRIPVQSECEVFGAVKITFNVGESPAQFHREPFFGLTTLVIDGQKTTLANLFQLGTHYDLATTKVWTVSHGGHTVEIKKVRPQWFGGLRPSTYTIKVDGAEVATSRGF
jgi:hypothetical protein